MEVKIFEEKQNEQTGFSRWRELVTDEQYERGMYYLNKYVLRQSEISQLKAGWDRIEELCACQRDPDPDDEYYPNNFIAIITPAVEGQVASIVEGDIEYSHVTNNPAHSHYMVQYDAASEYARRKNRSLEYWKDYVRQYEKLGNSIMAVSWEEGFSYVKGKPVGFPKLTVCPLLSVIVDGRIKDVKDVQYADYIIHEIGFQTIMWAREEYGDEKADAIVKGQNRYDGENPDVSNDDSDTFVLLHVWTRMNKQRNLQLIEMDANGFILRESDPSQPYYKYSENEYPFVFSRMIPITGQFYGYGDGALLIGIQQFQNNLADEVELACRFSAQAKLAIDPRAQINPDDLNSNPADIIVCPNPGDNIKILNAPGINPIVTQTMQENEQRAQRITRFNDIMSGNQQGVSATATQINAQTALGQVGISDKKSDIARAMEWVDRYSLKLCMQYWDKPFWATLGHNYQEYIDMNEMRSAPSAVPTPASTRDKIRKGFKDFMGRLVSPLKNDLAKDKDGNLIYTDIDWDTRVYIGKGIAKDSTTMYNILQGLAGTLMLDENGIQKQVIDFKVWQQAMEQLLGFKLTAPDNGEGMMLQPQFDVNSITGQNPIGETAAVQKPQQTPENLINTMPQMSGGDNRKAV